MFTLFGRKQIPLLILLSLSTYNRLQCPNDSLHCHSKCERLCYVNLVLPNSLICEVFLYHNEAFLVFGDISGDYFLFLYYNTLVKCRFRMQM